MIIGMSKLGDFVRERRRLVGYRTQESLAEKVGRDQAWVSRLERIAETLPPDEMSVLAAALGVSQAEILSAAGYDVESGVEGDTEAVSRARAILGSNDFTDDELQDISDMLQIILRRMGKL